MASAEITGWPTRKRVQIKLGISAAQLRRLEKNRELVGVSDLFGRLRFDPQKVGEISRRLARPEVKEPRSAKRPDGKTCARMFRMFDERRALRDIVVELEQTPETVLELRRQHADLGRDLLLAPRTVTELRELLAWEGDTEKSLLAAVSARLRYQYQRGAGLAVKKSNRNHNSRGDVNGKPDTGEAEADRRNDGGGEGALHGDPVG